MQKNVNFLCTGTKFDSSIEKNYPTKHLKFPKKSYLVPTLDSPIFLIVTAHDFSNCQSEVKGVVLGNYQSHSYTTARWRRIVQLDLQNCAPPKFVNAQYLEEPPLSDLFYLRKCVYKKVHVPLFCVNACLP